MRIALGLEYQGVDFHGWQKQEGLRTLQSVLEDALSSIAAHRVHAIVAGRTDAGVHAIGQVVHFDTSAERTDRAWVMGTNSHLPKQVCVRWAKRVPEDFHARFSATARRYRYIIDNRPERPAIGHQHTTWHYTPLDVNRMQAAAACFLGKHDFSAYRAFGCQAKSPVRHVTHIHLFRHGHFVVLDITANAFLYHMVRNIAGVLMSIGSGDAPIEWAQQVLEKRDRRQGGITAPAFGLYLVSASYPEKYEIPAVPIELPFF